MGSVANLKDLHDRRLMRRVYLCWGRLVRSVCQSSPFPPEFLAALLANESGGDASLSHFHPSIHQRLLAVQSGELLHYAGVTRDELDRMSEGELAACASSWGLTQIMGYRVLRLGETPRRLLDPEFNLRQAVRMLGIFAERVHAGLLRDFENLFRCWITGRPDGITTDPEYVEKGVRRLNVYRNIISPGYMATGAAA